MSTLTAVSLFSGVGGIDLALERAGIKVTAAVEIDPAACGVLTDQFPNTTLFNDVTEVTGDQLRATGFVPDRGLVVAGFPCQDLSVAGRRRGLGEDTRSGLYWHVVRLLAELRPRWVLLENVPGLLSAVCPCTGDGACYETGRHKGECGEWRKVKGTRTWFANVAHTVKGGACVGGCIRVHGGAMGAVLGSLGDPGYGFAYRVLDAQHFGVPQRRRRVFIVGCLGDDRRPVQVLLEPEGRGRNSAQGHTSGSRVAATLTAGTSRPGVSAPGRRQEDDVNLVVVSTLQGGGKRGYRVDAEGAGGGHLIVCPRGGGRGAPLVCFDPKAGGDHTSSGAFENGTGISPTLGGARPHAISSETTVRRLTPTECERLQGLPDGHTATSNGKPQADAARYRQLGNSVAVPVVEWIARGIVAADQQTATSPSPEQAAT